MLDQDKGTVFIHWLTSGLWEPFQQNINIHNCPLATDMQKHTALATHQATLTISINLPNVLLNIGMSYSN